jgi:diketogulonate reductase-like aldo/keto reductase
MREVSMAPDQAIPALGLGTWRLGESSRERPAEVAALRGAIAMGYRLIDTAEMYGEGGAEEVVGEAVAGALRAGEVQRESLFIVSKVYPHNASRRGTRAACERSLARLGLDRLDLYLLHWRGRHPIGDTVDAMRELVEAGLIARWGVSNFDTDDLAGLPEDCAANQVYYSVGERGPEFSLLPWQRARRMPLMAYSPIDQGALATDKGLQKLAEARGIGAAQLALAWVLAQPGVVAIPKAAREDHLRANLEAADLRLDEETLAAIERLHPPPRRKTPLAMIQCAVSAPRLAGPPRRSRPRRAWRR